MHIKLYHIVLCLLFFSIGLQGVIPVLPNLILIVSTVLFLWICADSKWNYKLLKKPSFVWLYGLLIFFLIIKFFILGDLPNETSSISKYMIPFAVLLQGMVVQPDRRETKLKAFILGVLVAVGISGFNLLQFYIENGSLSLTTGGHINKLIEGGRVYLSYAIIVSNIFLLNLFSTASHKLYKWIYLVLYVLLYLFLLLIAARLAIAIITVVSLVYLFKNLNFKQSSVIFVSIFILLTCMFLANPNLSNRFFYSNKSEEFISNFKEWEPRYVIWQCAAELISEQDFSIILGYNESQEIEDKLVTCYPSKIYKNDSKAAYFVSEKFNTHNQYLDFILYGGIVLLLLFLIFLIKLTLRGSINQFGYYLIFTLLCILLVENVFHRQSGVYLIGVILVAIYYSRDHTSYILKR